MREEAAKTAARKTTKAAADSTARTWAYLRVSTDQQDVDNQRLEILHLANEKKLGPVEFVEEVISGKVAWQDRELARVIDGMKAGDALVVAELSRLGRSMLEIMEILSVAARSGIKVYASKGNWTLDGSLQSKVIAMAFSMAAEIERDLLAQRTRCALAARQALTRNGKTWTSRSGRTVASLGRPKGPGKSKLDAHEAQIREYLDLGLPKVKIAKKFGTTAANLRHWLRRRQIVAGG